jgi:hypothetical protein
MDPLSLNLKMIKKIWEWIKAMVKLPKLLPRHQAQEEAEPAPGELTELDKKLGQKIQRRQEKMGKRVNTSAGGPNMPRYQFCTCGQRGKRTRKTMGGAYYRCRIHGEFFIRAPTL